MGRPHAVIVGAGIAGLTAAIDLACANFKVTVLERAATAGGKMREINAGGASIDAGPTVLTMKHVFEDVFVNAGSTLATHVALDRLEILARHAWSDGSILDLFADRERSAAAIAKFAGNREADGFRAFSERAANTYKTLEDSFIRTAEPTPVSLARQSGISGLGDLWRISPFTTLWSGLGRHFRDPRLRQLFGRYATYCGSSPFDAPATLMLVADVEAQGVWTVRGGMQRLADALTVLARSRDVTFQYGADVSEIEAGPIGATGVRLSTGETITADYIVLNADPAAVATGLFGGAVASAVAVSPGALRSLSAITFAFVAKTSGFPLHRHNVFFSGDYKREFDDIFTRYAVPTAPTVYVCAQDRGDHFYPAFNGEERLLCLINAPANGDTRTYNPHEIAQYYERMIALFTRCGLHIDHTSEPKIVTTPSDFHRLFPATGGALYGQASHGWTASFNRPHARTKIPRLYLAGGATHPGPGVPMAALSGRFAAQAALTDHGSRLPFATKATLGGTSTH